MVGNSRDVRGRGRRGRRRPAEACFEVQYAFICNSYGIKEPINFQALTIRKWSKTTDSITTMRYIGATAFKDVCLVLDGDIENQLCTDSYRGWSWDER